MKIIAFSVFAAAALGAALFVRPGETLQSLTLGDAISTDQEHLPPGIKCEPERAADALRNQKVELTTDGFIQTARLGTQSQVTLFLKAGFYVDERDAGQRTALIAAAETGNLPLARLLLEEGADVCATSSDGTTPLIAAARAGTVSLVETLLKHGAPIDATDAQGQTALLHAVTSGQAAAAHAILAGQPNLSLRDHTGRDAFEYAVLAGGDTPLARSLLAAASPRAAWTSETREMLFRALRARDAEGVRLFLQKHLPEPTLGEGRQTLIAYTIAWNNLEQMRMLLDAGADPNVPLACPAEKQFVGCFTGRLIPHYVTEEKGMTPLMLAAGLGRADFVQALLDCGARRGAETAKYHITPLSFAAWADDVPSMLLLLGKSPRPEDQPMRVRISLGEQRAYVYKNGEIAMTTQVSTGRSGFRTPTGDFVVTDKHVSRFSSLYKVPMPFFMRLSCSDVGMHAGVVPGYPASHGCIRMPREKVSQLFRELQIGTPVSIVN